MKNKSQVTVVVSQPMYFPWVGLLEQIKLADIFIFYDDVQFTRGFFNRVQVKTNSGTKWLSVPLRDYHRGQMINEVQIDNSEFWWSRHREILRQNYRASPNCDAMLKIADEVFSSRTNSLAELAICSTKVLANYFGVSAKTQYMYSSKMGIKGSGTQRLLDLCVKCDAQIYVTGSGAKRYLDHELFENNGIEVRYMNYAMTQYQQLHGQFTPFVSALDLIANCGRHGADFITSKAINWRNVEL